MRTSTANRISGQRVIAGITLVGAVLLLGGSPMSVSAGDSGNPNPRVLPPHSRAFGKSYVEWVLAQTQWLFTLPKDLNPVLDGEECENGAINQSGPVWFLAGSPEVIVRHCTVPVGKAIFVPISGTWCSIAEGSGTTEAELRACAPILAGLEHRRDSGGRWPAPGGSR